MTPLNVILAQRLELQLACAILAHFQHFMEGEWQPLTSVRHIGVTLHDDILEIDE